MNANEFKELIRTVAAEAEKSYREEALSLDKSAKNEKKALMIAADMAKHSATFANMHPDISIRERRVFAELHYFDSEKTEYDTLDFDGKELFLAYAFPVSMLRHSFYDRHAEKAKDYATAEFEDKVILGSLDSILDKWSDLYKEHGSLGGVKQ